MAKPSAKGFFIFIFGAVFIFGGLIVAYRYVLDPYVKEKTKNITGSKSQYKHEINSAVALFSGNCILRSPVFNNILKKKGIRFNIVDVSEDYEKKFGALSKKKIDMASFPVNTYIEECINQKKSPATITMLIDETSGADAIVAYKDAVKNLNSMNNAKAKFVVVAKSPGSFMSNILVADCGLANLPEEWQIEKASAEEVLNALKATSRNEKRAFALEEPYLSMALEDPNVHILLDSSRLSGCIIDGLVVERSYLQKNPELVKAVVDAYFRALYHYQQQEGGLVSLVIEDAKLHGSRILDEKSAKRIVGGIKWKRTLENYAHFGVKRGSKLKHIEDMLSTITTVLQKTNVIEKNTLDGKYHTLFYDSILKQMYVNKFHPGKQLNILQGNNLGIADMPEVDEVVKHPNLSDAQWNSLVVAVGMKVKPIQFGRGNAKLSIVSRRELDGLAANMDKWSGYFMVKGHSLGSGDPEANRKLAESRAKAVASYLVTKGVEANRIKAVGVKSNEKGGSTTVSIERYEQPY